MSGKKSKKKLCTTYEGLVLWQIYLVFKPESRQMGWEGSDSRRITKRRWVGQV